MSPKEHNELMGGTEVRFKGTRVMENRGDDMYVITSSQNQTFSVNELLSPKPECNL